MKVIKLLKSDRELENKGVGISIKEIALLLVWKDDDAYSLYEKIKELRLSFPFPTSNEVILDACDEHEPRWNSWQDITLIKDVPDEFVRKMRITGLFTLRGAGRYLDLNTKKENKIKYILSNYEESYIFSSSSEYFNYCASLDENILKLEEEPILRGDDFKLDYWTKHYPVETVNHELINMTKKNPSSKDPILRTMSNPVRLEFLCALSLKHQILNAKIIPRYKIDDEGVPYTHAPSNGHDIECILKDKVALIEATLITTGQQVHSEGPQTLRHLKTYRESNPDIDALCVFIAPNIHKDFQEWVEYQNSKINSYLAIKIEDFIADLEDKNLIQGILN